MKTMKWSKICRRGYALVLAAGLLIPGISQAAIVSGETTQATSAGDITVAMTVDDIDTIISIIWPENRWVGISFGDATDTVAHDGGYVINSSLDGIANEANGSTTRPPSAPTIQAIQDLTIDSFVTGSGISTIVLSRASNTGDSQDFQFAAIEQTISLQWALGPLGADTSTEHDIRGLSEPLVLTAVPVPAALPLLASGLFALGLLTRRKKAA